MEEKSELSTMHPDVETILFSEEDIAQIVQRLGAEITRDYQGKDLVLIAVLRGAVVFMGDLMRAIDLPLAIDFMAVSSYGSNAKSSGIVRIVKDLDMDIKGRDVLIVEDILDSGLTLKYLMKNLSSRKPASLEVAAFLWKDVEDKQAAINPKYVGAHCPDEFVVGYGLDFAERYRNLPYVGILKPEVYS
ncbi:hypoxanthine phosphoribosyltransferase [uncultured Enorma sp.]|uniref:hypoxanthine phosphoribosyltransferase n=1 Tax=uncultured Enorma sp. TaxID=1714346 RepID=UPI002592AA09|nr:hypoxanthine phosphoribosyltransferase [uncultured Enorma sp.]